MRKLLAAILLLTLLLVGCAAPEEEPEVTLEDFQHQDTAPTQDSKGSDLPETFSLAYHKDHTLDPITCGEGIQQDVASLLYEPLFRLDSSFQPSPLLCESARTSDGGKTYVLTIRQGVLFTDGTELTAADAAASLRRAMTSQRYSHRLRNVLSVTTNREGQVIITLSSPNTAFLSLLDIPVVKRGTEQLAVPIGTGPYVLVTTSEGSVLQANPEWWQGKPLPVQTIPLVHAKDQDTAMYLFSSRRVQLLTIDPTGEQVSASGKVSEARRPTTVMQYIGFNTRSGVFAEAAARSAFSAGLQREMLVTAFLSGHAQAAQFPLSPADPLYPGHLETPYSYDNALSALSGAGQNSGETRELTLLVNEENSFRLANAAFVAESMSLGDWHISVVSLPWEEYLLALNEGRFDLYYGEVRMTADWDLTTLVGTGGSLNYGGYTSADTDALLAAFSASSDRAAAAEALYSHLTETVPIAPLCFRSYLVLTHPGVVEHLSASPSGTFCSLDIWTIHLHE